MTCRASFGVGVVIVLGVTLRFLGVAAYPPGYSYSKFSGPVSGPEHEIIVKGKHGEPAKDYVAKPDYQFSYGVEDPKSKVSQSRKESRHGDEVHGEYSVVEPDGTVRTVKYRADKVNGFQAQVITDGKVVTHGNTGSSRSDEDDHDDGAGSSSSNDGGYQVTHDFHGSHSMEHGTMKDGSNSLSSGRSSSEEGYAGSDEGDEDDVEGDDDDDEDED